MKQKRITATTEWLSIAALKQVISHPPLRRAIEDHFMVRGYNTVNVWITRKDRKLLHPSVIKLIELYTGLSETEIIITNS